ncbi:unnamed protein product, partial [Cyprideis torosa]
CFIIPVRYGGFGINTELCESETTTTTSSNITEWIVSMFGNAQEAVWNHLEALLKSLNSFFHPSNSGPWERVLVGFLNNMAASFVSRVQTERFKSRHWNFNTPEEYLLSDSEIRRFVSLLLPPALLAMHSKSESENASDALHYLR